ncbi:CLUMA_CG005004, isoform A [Clunio marinus]|uniref:CLUMA_CG005004, isoform A n=1 Tax=Clunio marinus TaxID=568069 RepID=A0A1J1HUW1_9DIPT|nr:CLUMA_CG005004, isoform A [Clunio marinus]
MSCKSMKRHKLSALQFNSFIIVKYVTFNYNIYKAFASETFSLSNKIEKVSVSEKVNCEVDTTEHNLVVKSGKTRERRKRKF